MSPPEHAASAFEAKYGDDVAAPPIAGDENVINGAKGSKVRKATKERATFYLPCDLVDDLRNAVVALRREPQRFTMASIVETAVRAELARLERDYNNGEAFPSRELEPYVGRPPK